MIRKRKSHPKRQFQVVVCFGCGALIGRNDRNFVSIFWNDGDPGRDEVVTPHRASVVRMCCGCRELLQQVTWFFIRIGSLEVKLVMDTTNEMSKTGAHGVTPCRGIRKVV